MVVVVVVLSGGKGNVGQRWRGKANAGVERKFAERRGAAGSYFPAWLSLRADTRLFYRIAITLCKSTVSHRVQLRLTAAILGSGRARHIAALQLARSVGPMMRGGESPEVRRTIRLRHWGEREGSGRVKASDVVDDQPARRASRSRQ